MLVRTIPEDPGNEEEDRSLRQYLGQRTDDEDEDEGENDSMADEGTQMDAKFQTMKSSKKRTQPQRRQSLDIVGTLDKEIEQLQAQTMRMRISYDRKQRENVELKKMVSSHIAHGKARAEWSYKHQEAKRSIRLRKNEINKAVDVLNKRLTENRKLLDELNNLRQSRAHADNSYVSLAKEEANVARQCAQLETKLQQMHLEHRKLSNKIEWMEQKATYLEQDAVSQEKENEEALRRERKELEAEVVQEVEVAFDDDDDELSMISSEPSVDGGGQEKRPATGNSYRKTASAQSVRSDKGDGKSITRREFLLTEAESLVSEMNETQKKISSVDRIIDAAMEEYSNSGEYETPESENERMHLAGQMIMRTELRMENLMQEIQDMLQEYTQINHHLRDHKAVKDQESSQEHNDEMSQSEKSPQKQKSGSGSLALGTSTREGNVTAHALEEHLREVRKQVGHVKEQEQVLQSTLHKLFGHPLFAIASEALNPYSGMAAFTGGISLSRQSSSTEGQEPEHADSGTSNAQTENEPTPQNQEESMKAIPEEMEPPIASQVNERTVVKSVQDLHGRLRALEKTIRQIQAAEKLLGISEDS